MNIDVTQTRIYKLRTYLMNIIKDINSNYKQINANYLSDDPDNYSLDKIPTASTVERWITGIEIHKDIFSFRSRMDYSAEAISNLENIGFYETFENIIYEKDKNKELPEIDGIEKIECLNCGSMVSNETSTAEFDIQLQITYIVNEEE